MRAIGDKGGSVTFGAHAERIVSPGTEVLICLDKTKDDEGWFAGNIDYDSSVYSFIGSVPISGYVIDGLDKDLITFLITKETGLTYVGGIGRVVTKNGDSTLFSN